MISLKTLSVLAIAAATALALPTPVEEAAEKREVSLVERQWRGGNRNYQRPDDTVWVTVTGYGGSTPTATATPTPTEAAESSTPTLGTSSGDGYMAIVSKWRSAGGLPALTQDSTLEANALKTSTASVGGLIHQLNPGSMAQVLAPGTADNFESVYLGGWLCEIPTLPGLNGICATAAQGWNHAGQTGHAEILTSTSYKKIGCALASSTGVWACDLA